MEHLLQKLYPKSFNKLLILLVFWIFTVKISANHSEQVEILKEKVSQWIQLEQDIAKHKSDWEQEKILLQDEVAILMEDNERLTKEISDSVQYINHSDKDRGDLVLKRDRLIRLFQAMAPEIRKLELSCLRLYSFLPELLKQRLDDKYQKIRIVENQRIRDGQIGDRFMNVLGFFKEVEKFNSKVNVVREIISVDGGALREYNLVYLGLGAAYFIDDAGQNAGYGLPSEGKWEFYQRNGLIREVARFMDIYNNKRPPEFVRLPVEIREILNR